VRSHLLKKLLIVGLLLVGAVFMVWIWPSPSYDIAQVHPRLRALRTPYRSVRTDYFLDGGSVGVTIVDRDGQMLQAALPVSDGPGEDNKRYDRVFLGLKYLGQTGAVDVVEIMAPEHSKRMLIRAIAAYSPYDVNRSCALHYLRGGPKDYIEAAVHVVQELVTKP